MLAFMAAASIVRTGPSASERAAWAAASTASQLELPCPHAAQRYLFVCINRRPDGHPKGSCAEKGSEALVRPTQGGARQARRRAGDRARLLVELPRPVRDGHQRRAGAGARGLRARHAGRRGGDGRRGGEGARWSSGWSSQGLEAYKKTQARADRCSPASPSARRCAAATGCSTRRPSERAHRRSPSRRAPATCARFARDKTWRIAGTVDAEGLAHEAQAARGRSASGCSTSGACPTGCAFVGDDGGRYELSGQKEWSGLAPARVDDAPAGEPVRRPTATSWRGRRCASTCARTGRAG